MKYYITHSLYTYAAKNRKWADVLECVKEYENLIVADDLALDAMKAEFEMFVTMINEAYPKCKELFLSFSKDRVSIYQMTNGNQDNVFFLTISKVKGIYHFSECVASQKSLEDEN
ncbi:hypothetical protein D0T49_02000 [Paludibacter sp. 221]|uniref:hypothetical protein n=1 Tax=Paludibacter sp. 221 TaxID=2302939 RepID=UPI0013D7F31A|nr:hypothetical protein [Paludibacter sp. 221]NDV45823.1 hypothetical protein [Paludibacter sp. 221]